MSDLVLNSDSLFSKFGFGDGDIFGDWWWDEFNDSMPERKMPEDAPHIAFDHMVLCKLIRDHLVPLLPAGTEVYEIWTSHNPMRVVDGTEEFPNVEVTVEREAILEALKECWEADL